jgi:superfamily II RNA helicase
LEATIKRRQLEEAKEQLLYQTSANSLMFSGEYAGRLKVLRTLNYIDRQNMVGLKGKVACEISNQASWDRKTRQG